MVKRRGNGLDVTDRRLRVPGIPRRPPPIEGQCIWGWLSVGFQWRGARESPNTQAQDYDRRPTGGCHLRPRSDMRILVVEDNTELAQWLSRALRQAQYTVDCIDNGLDADFALKSERFNLVILDLALPKLPGRDVLRRMRARQDPTPVLVLTANNSIQSRVSELDQGADDYMAKPFEIEELEARIRVLLRRSSGQHHPILTCGDLSYDTNTREFLIESKPLTLTPRERSVLELLVRKAGTTVSKQSLAQSLFSLDDEASVDAIEIYVHRLRKKLDHSTAKIITLRGLGYLLRQAERA
jgi:two-component system response regulator TctD